MPLPALQEIGLDDAMISVQPEAVGNAWIFAIQDFWAVAEIVKQRLWKSSCS
jgi:hypothetical protein